MEGLDKMSSILTKEDSKIDFSFFGGAGPKQCFNFTLIGFSSLTLFLNSFKEDEVQTPWRDLIFQDEK